MNPYIIFDILFFVMLASLQDFAVLDADNSGTISQEEFFNFFKVCFWIGLLSSYVFIWKGLMGGIIFPRMNEINIFLRRYIEVFIKYWIFYAFALSDFPNLQIWTNTFSNPHPIRMLLGGYGIRRSCETTSPSASTNGQVICYEWWLTLLNIAIIANPY